MRASVNAPADTTGLDAGKKSPGRKRGLAVDVLGLVIAVTVTTAVLGLVIAVMVTTASVHDNQIGKDLLDKVSIDNPSVTTAWVDAGFKNAVEHHGTTLGITVETVHRDPATKGFVPQPKRWVVEQVYGNLMLHCRLARDYETLTSSSESMVYWSMTALMTRRLTGTATTTWRPAAPAEQLRAAT